MFITRECDYAVRIIRALHDNKKRPVKEICDIEQIPQPYAYKILKKLEKHHLVSGFRGINGGYALICEPKSLTLYDIAIAIEGEMPINACLREDFDCLRNKGEERCKVHTEFCRIQDILIKALKEKNLEEILYQ